MTADGEQKICRNCRHRIMLRCPGVGCRIHGKRHRYESTCDDCDIGPEDPR